MKPSPMMLALVTDAFGGRGGIAYSTPPIFSERWPKPVLLLDEPNPDPGALAVAVRARFGRETFAASAVLR